MIDGEVVHESDQPIDSLLLILRGQITLLAPESNGTWSAIHSVSRDGQFGLIGIASEESMPIRAVADGDLLALRFSRSDALQLLNELPLWRSNVVRILGPSFRKTFFRQTMLPTLRIVTFVHATPDSRDVSQQLVQQLIDLGETVCVVSDQVEAYSRLPCEHVDIGRPGGGVRHISDVRSEISNYAHADRIVVDVLFPESSGQLDALFQASDNVFTVVEDDVSTEICKAITEVESCQPGALRKSHIIRIPAHSGRVPVIKSESQQLFKRSFIVQEGTSRLGRAVSKNVCLRRILHHLRGISIGVALGGGAARGMAHLGVLEVLDEAGITIDIMSGTSAGALTGVLYAAGYEPGELAGLFADDLEPGWPFRLMPYGEVVHLLYKYRSGGWDGMLRKYLEQWNLEQLAIPFNAVSVDLVRAEQVVRDRGDAVDAILESINLPGLARPIFRQEMALVDGGVLNVLPANIITAQGSSFTIAVDVSSSIRFAFGGIGPDAGDSHRNIPKAGTVSTMTRVRVVQDRNLRVFGASSADMMISPDVSQVQLSDFVKAREIAQAGRVATEACLDDLKRRLHDIDAALFPL